MAIVGKSVDYGDIAVVCKVLHFLLLEGTDHYAVEVAGEDTGGILNRLASAYLEVTGGKEECISAQLVHTCFKGNTGTCGGLLEDHTQSFALKVAVGNVVLQLVLELVSKVQDLDDILP